MSYTICYNESVKKVVNEVDTYIAQFDGEVRTRLETIQKIVSECAPEATESIAYGMPAYKLRGKPLVYFAGYAHHIGLYALPTTHVAFKNEFSAYKQGKGSVQFPLEKPLPVELIRRVVAHRVNELTL